MVWRSLQPYAFRPSAYLALMVRGKEFWYGRIIRAFLDAC